MNEGKRQISVSIATVGSIGIALVTALAAYFGTLSSQNKQIGELTTRVAITEVKQSADEQTILSMESNVQFIRDQMVRISARLQVPVPEDQKQLSTKI